MYYLQLAQQYKTIKLYSSKKIKAGKMCFYFIFIINIFIIIVYLLYILYYIIIYYILLFLVRF